MTTRASILSLLGGFLFTVDGERRDLTARKVKALMCRLAFDDAPLPRDQLSALLWPDSAPSAARQLLRQALSDLRRGLEGSAIGLTVTPREAALETYGGSIDVREFRRLAASGDAEDWRQAMALYRGSLLEGLEVRVDTFDEWLDQARRELSRTALSLCRALAGRHGDHVEEAIRWNKRLLALDPLDEPAHRDLMRLYIVAGRDGAASRQYLHCRSILERELGIAPEAETAALYRSLLSQRAAPAAGAETAPALSVPARDPELLPAPGRLRPAVVLSCRLAVDPSDPERADPERQRQLDQVPRVVRSYGGRLVAQAGSRIVCGFGLNRVRGTEADRAWLAAAELTAGLPGLRCGMACGQVIYRQEDGSLVGQAAAEAEELAAEAAPGEVRLSDAVAAARRRDGAGGLPETGAPPAGAAGAEAFPLRGRARAIRQFVAALDSSRDGGYGCALLLRGEAGTGKTRLVQEFTALAAGEGFAVHAAPACDSGAARDAEAVVDLVRLSARNGAVVLVVDELHRADPLTLSVLPRLALAAAELPVVLVMTSRVSGEALDPEWRAAMGNVPLITLDLGPLGRDDAGGLACAMGEDRLAGKLDRAGGDPGDGNLSR